MVRPADGSTGAVRRHPHLLLHPRAQGDRAAPYEPAARSGRVRGLLCGDDSPLRPAAAGTPATVLAFVGIGRRRPERAGVIGARSRKETRNVIRTATISAAMALAMGAAVVLTG